VLAAAEMMGHEADCSKSLDFTLSVCTAHTVQCSLSTYNIMCLISLHTHFTLFRHLIAFQQTKTIYHRFSRSPGKNIFAKTAQPTIA